jgi:hypothetical protein
MAAVGRLVYDPKAGIRATDREWPKRVDSSHLNF